jgi:hypothetical protein
MVVGDGNYGRPAAADWHAAERFVVNLPAVALACSRWSGRRMDDECHYITTHIALVVNS